MSRKIEEDAFHQLSKSTADKFRVASSNFEITSNGKNKNEQIKQTLSDFLHNWIYFIDSVLLAHRKHHDQCINILKVKGILNDYARASGIKIENNTNRSANQSESVKFRNVVSPTNLNSHPISPLRSPKKGQSTISIEDRFRSALMVDDFRRIKDILFTNYDLKSANVMLFDSILNKNLY